MGHAQEVRERAIGALVEHGSIRKAAKSAGVPPSTLHRWLSDFVPEDVHSLVRQARQVQDPGTTPYVEDTETLQAENAQQESEYGSALSASLEPDTGPEYAATIAAPQTPTVQPAEKEGVPPQISWAANLDDPLYLRAMRRYISGIANGAHAPRALIVAKAIHPDFDLSPEEQVAVRAGVQRVAMSEDRAAFEEVALADSVPPRYLRELVDSFSMDTALVNELADSLFALMLVSYTAGINLQLSTFGLDPIAGVTDPGVLGRLRDEATWVADGIATTWGRDAASRAGLAWLDAQAVTMPVGDYKGPGGWAGAVGEARHASARSDMQKWAADRSKYKSDQWSADASGFGFNLAAVDWQDHNAVAETGRIEPNEASCDHCFDMVALGRRPAADLLRDPPPWHSRCRHSIAWDVEGQVEHPEDLWRAQASTSSELAMAELHLAGRIELAWSPQAQSAGGLAHAAMLQHTGAAPHGWIPKDDWLQGQKTWEMRGEAAWAADRQNWPLHAPGMQWTPAPSDPDTHFAEGAKGSQFRVTKEADGHSVHAHIPGRGSFSHPGRFAKLADAKAKAHEVHEQLHREALEGARAYVAFSPQSEPITPAAPISDASAKSPRPRREKDGSLKVLPWHDWPRPLGTGHGGGGYSAEDITNTDLGDIVELTVQQELHMDNLHPGRRQGTLDVGVDGHAYEVKGGSQKSKEYHVKMARADRLKKIAWLANNEFKKTYIGHTMIVVYSSAERMLYAYSKPGIGSYRLAGPKEGWVFHGTIPLDLGTDPDPFSHPNDVQWAGQPLDMVSVTDPTTGVVTTVPVNEHLETAHGTRALAGNGATLHKYIHEIKARDHTHGYTGAKVSLLRPELASYVDRGMASRKDAEMQERSLVENSIIEADRSAGTVVSKEEMHDQNVVYDREWSAERTFRSRRGTPGDGPGVKYSTGPRSVGNAQEYLNELIAKFGDMFASSDLKVTLHPRLMWAAARAVEPDRLGNKGWEIWVDPTSFNQATLIHELAHVFAKTQAGVMGHGASFRQVYEYLLTQELPGYLQAMDWSTVGPAMGLAESSVRPRAQITFDGELVMTCANPSHDTEVEASESEHDPIIAAGLAVIAADTGRVLMLQRHFDDPNHGGEWEFPGGHLEDGEEPLDAAQREWCEEIGRALPDGTVTGSWVAPSGTYQGFAYQIANEDAIPVTDGRRQIENPDDPDGDCAEVCAWWEPSHLPGMPALRPVVNGTEWSKLKPNTPPEQSSSMPV